METTVGLIFILAGYFLCFLAYTGYSCTGIVPIHIPNYQDP